MASKNTSDADAETAKETDTTAMDSIDGAGLTADDIVSAMQSNPSAPADPHETLLVDLHRRITEAETKLGEALAWIAKATDHFGGKI